MRSAPFMLSSLAYRVAIVSSLLLSPAHAIEIEQRSLSNEPALVPTAPAPAPAPASVPAPSIAPKVTTTASAEPLKPAAPVPTKPSPVATNPAWDMFQQVEELRSTVATLQGTVEEQQQLIERLQNDLRSRYTDLDQRLEQLTKPVAPAPVVPETATAPVAPTEPTETVTESTEKPTETANANVVIPSQNKPELSAAEIELQKAAYLTAYQSFRREGATPAIAAMSNFLERYPDSVFAPNAHYWLGEFQLASEPANYDKAEASFQRVIRDFQASPKVPAAFYKLGTIADLKGNKSDARNWMNKLLTQFPNSPEARLAKSFLNQTPKQ